MLRILFYLPLLLSEWFHLLFPRRVFVRTYKQSSTIQRELEQDLRNKTRRAAFVVKRELYND